MRIRNSFLIQQKAARLDRFRLRLDQLATKHTGRSLQSEAIATAPASTPRVARQRTISGSARSDDGATSPWLLLPAERSFHLYVPEHHKNGDGIPLVLMIHGCRQSAAEFEQGTRMNALADAQGFAVLYAEQSTFANFRRCWNWFEPNTAAGHGECAIVLEMISSARKHVKIDALRVYVVGMSSGAALAGLIAFHHPDLIAGVAIHSGLPPLSNPSPATAVLAMRNGARGDTDALAESFWETQADLPPPLIVIHGDADARVHERNATAIINLWEALWNGAPNGESSAIKRDERTFERSDTSRAYTQLDLLREGRIVARSIRIHGLAHAWSGGDAALEFNDGNGPDASSVIWKFLERQSHD
jgi:poly(hydroxyalkanoate) depolymerase family esterase